MKFLNLKVNSKKNIERFINLLEKGKILMKNCIQKDSNVDFIKYIPFDYLETFDKILEFLFSPKCPIKLESYKIHILGNREDNRVFEFEYTYSWKFDEKVQRVSFGYEDILVFKFTNDGNMIILVYNEKEFKAKYYDF